MSDEVHGEYPPNANQVEHVWVDPYGKVSNASTDSLTREKIKEVAEKMEGELFVPPSTLQPSVLSGGGEDDPSFNLPDKFKRSYAMSPTQFGRVTLHMGDHFYDLDKMVKAMIASMEALAEAIGLCSDGLMPPQMRAQRSIENVLRKFDEARIQ